MQPRVFLSVGWLHQSRVKVVVHETTEPGCLGSSASVAAGEGAGLPNVKRLKVGVSKGVVTKISQPFHSTVDPPL